MLGTSVEDIAQFLHQEERLDSVRLGVGCWRVGFTRYSETLPALTYSVADPECSGCCPHPC